MARRLAQLVYEDVERAFTVRSKSLLTNAPDPRKWWPTVETGGLLLSSSSLPPLADRGGKLLWSADGKASLFLVHFNVKQCRDSFQQPRYGDPSPVLCSVAFRSIIVCSLLLDLDPCGGNYPDGMFSLFYKQVGRKLVTNLAVILRHLVRGARFPAFWRLVDVVPVPNEFPSSDVEDYRPTLVFSKKFDKIVARKYARVIK